MWLLLNLVKNTNNGMQPLMQGYASALNKSIIVIQNEDHQHALKEIDAAASAVASDQMQVVRILKYVLEGTLK